jgi:hypothetical protein
MEQHYTHGKTQQPKSSAPILSDPKLDSDDPIGAISGVTRSRFGKSIREDFSLTSDYPHAEYGKMRKAKYGHDQKQGDSQAKRTLEDPNQEIDSCVQVIL